MDDFVTHSYERGKRALESRDAETIKAHGQFLTPPNVAHYMANQLGGLKNGANLLEPACGSGVLICAVIERLINERKTAEINVTAYEVDPELAEISRQVLALVSQKAEKSGLQVHWQVLEKDFVLDNIPEKQPALFELHGATHKSFDFIISNPPYFKLNAEDKRAKALFGKLNGQTNIYTVFMALGTQLLVPGGKSCFIVPRSFCSGAYFAEFRRDLLNQITPQAIHLFKARDKVFQEDDVLQENVIFTFSKHSETANTRYLAGSLRISMSTDDSNLDLAISREVALRHFVNNRDDLSLFRIPTGQLDEQILDAVDQWTGSLEKYNLQVSTGRVVPFRSKSLLKEKVIPENGTAPLLWMKHIQPYQVAYPLKDFDKPQAISTAEPVLLLPSANYVLLRRFSAKEDRRRLVSAPLIGQQFGFDLLGFENHLNVIFKKKEELSIIETLGFCALFNSALIDRYIRIANGNTQVNAAELRALPLPPLEVIQQIGREIQKFETPSFEQADQIVFSALWKANLLSEDFPIIQETRIMMGKIEQAQEILQALGLPNAQQNEISALTLLALAQLTESSPWEQAAAKNLRVHDILIEIKQNYGREYAENSRETIRRKVLHQLEQAGIVIRNIDDPTRPTNSGLNNYILADIVLDVLRAYKTSSWDEKLGNFLTQQGLLLETYEKTREQNKVPLQVAEGTVYKLSPGKHNQLQAAIVAEFGPRFAPGARLIYLGDTASKTLVFEQVIFDKLNIPVTGHGKLPDIMLYDEKRNWLFLLEAVTAHGPVSPKRFVELEKLLGNCPANRVYVTAFLDFATFKKFSNEIAWETEVWIADMPSHMIHFNGDKFLGPNNS
jgi:adenine-specific DNA-methyltransferase